ncbi:hypothetical protein AB9M62_57625 [Bacillales bacterium AN1005]
MKQHVIRLEKTGNVLFGNGSSISTHGGDEGLVLFSDLRLTGRAIL